MRLCHMPLGRQLALNVGLVCVLLFALLVIATTWLSARAAKSAMESSLGQQMSAIAVWVEDSLKAAQDSATKSMLIYHSLMPGPITVSGDTQPAGALPAVPTLRAGNVVLNGNMEFLQRVRDQVGAEPAVMVMHEGKLVRVATFLTNKDGSPRFGSSLDASGAETRSVMAGQTYYGLVERNGKFYMSIFEPVMDGNKRVIGAISMRLGIDGILDRLSRNVSNVRIGETGYVFIYAPAADPADNRFIVHPTLAGKTFREINEGDLNDMAESIQGKSEAVAYYDFKDPRDGRSGEKVVVLRAAKDAGWVVGAGSWVEEFTAEAMTLRNEIMGLVAICAVLIILTMVWLTNLRLRPVGAMVDVVKRMGDGDLSYPLPEVDAGSRNEVDLLSLSLKRMQGSMSDMVRRVGGASRELESATQQLQFASAQVFEGSEEQSHSATALASAVEELSVSIGHVSGNAGEPRPWQARQPTPPARATHA